MAVEVIFTMASRRFRIVGSGTSRTSTDCLPVQQLARMVSPSWGRVSGDRLGRALGDLLAGRLAGRTALRADHLAELHDLLEAPQVVAQLLVRLLAEQLRDDGARAASGRAVAQVDHDLRAPSARGAAEAHGAGVLDVGARDGPPGDHLVLAVLRDL